MKKEYGRVETVTLETGEAIDVHVDDTDILLAVTTSPGDWCDKNLTIPLGKKDKDGKPLFKVVALKPEYMRQSDKRLEKYLEMQHGKTVELTASNKAMLQSISNMMIQSVVSKMQVKSALYIINRIRGLRDFATLYYLKPEDKRELENMINELCIALGAVSRTKCKFRSGDICSYWSSDVSCLFRTYDPSTGKAICNEMPIVDK